MKKHKKQKSAARLIDPPRRGTVILGSPRMGTHFVHEVCRKLALQAGLEVEQHGEIAPHNLSNKFVAAENLPVFFGQARPDRYHLVIVNHEQYKMILADASSIIDDWYVLRLDDNDKYRWFWSWFWFMHSPLIRQPLYPELMNSLPKPGMHDGRTVWIDDHDVRKDVFDGQTGRYLFTKIVSITRFDDRDIFDDNLRETNMLEFFGHHGSPRKLYDRFLAQIQNKLSLFPLLEHLPAALNNHVLSKIIPADEEIPYQSLAALQDQEVQWQPNAYPDMSPAEIFNHGEMLQAILDRWSMPLEGKFKEKL